MKTTLILPLIFCLTLSACHAGSGSPGKLKKIDLNQVELMKKFVGRWTCELGNDTVLIGENVAFGTGLVCNSQITVNGKILSSVKQLYGYDKKIDKYIVAELIEASPVIEICTSWFTSPTTGELVVTNPDNAPFRFKFEFKTDDLIVQTAIQNDQVVKEITLIRIKAAANTIQ